MRVNLPKLLAGGISFLLPLFFILQPYANTIEAQLTYSKFWLIMIAGGIAYSVYLTRAVNVIFALINLCVLFGTVTVIDGNLNMYLYPYVYWLSASFVAVWFVHQERDVKEFTLRCLVWACCASSVLAVLQTLDLDPILQYAPTITPHDRIRPIGLIGQTTKFGALLAMALPIAIVFRDYVSIALIAYALYATKSSFAYLAGIAAVLIVLRDIIGRARVMLVAALGLVAFFITKSMPYFEQMYMDNGRFQVWEATIKAWLVHQPMFGFGLGSYQNLFSKAFQPASVGAGQFIQAHNDYLQWAFELGWVGVAALILVAIAILNQYVFFWFFKLTWREGEEKITLALQGALAAIIVNAIGNFPFQLAPHYLIAIVSCAYLLKYQDNRLQ